MTKNKFTIGNYLVFPKYGIGKCDSYQQVNIDGKNYEMLVINFAQSKMVLKLPKDKLSNIDCRSLSTPKQMHEALQILSKPKRIYKDWKRRQRVYYRKITSNQLHLIAEVISELRPLIAAGTNVNGASEIYKSALNLFIQELMVVNACDMKTALQMIEHPASNIL